MNDTQHDADTRLIHVRRAHKATDMHEIEHLAASLARACPCDYEGCRKFLAQRTVKLAEQLGLALVDGDETGSLRTALNAASAMNGVHERTIARLRTELEQAKLAPGPTGLTRAWSGYDDDEFWFPQFADIADAKAYAEAAFRAQCAALETDDPGEISWKERAARTDATGYPGMFDLQSDVGGDGWVVCEVLVHPDLASGLREHPIVTDEPEPGAVEEYPGQGVLPVETPRGFRVGDLVEITGRDDEFDSPRGMQLNGRTGHVTELDPGADYPIGLTVEGWIGPVWCKSGEIRHADTADCPSCRGTGSRWEPDPGDAEFESDRECVDCDGTGRVAAGAASAAETAGSAK